MPSTLMYKSSKKDLRGHTRTSSFSLQMSTVHRVQATLFKSHSMDTGCAYLWKGYSQ